MKKKPVSKFPIDMSLSQFTFEQDTRNYLKHRKEDLICINDGELTLQFNIQESNTHPVMIFNKDAEETLTLVFSSNDDADEKITTDDKLFKNSHLKKGFNYVIDYYSSEATEFEGDNQEVMERIKAKVNSHPLHTRMKVKIFYKGRNRNGSFIDETVEQQLKDTLYNTPIVGEYWETIEDFGTHGIELKSDEHGYLKVKRTTVPFGVVPSDTEIWYELSTDKDGVERNYICAEAVLWSKRYPELSGLIEAGRPQSMELEPDTIEGDWIEMEKDDYIFKYTKADLSALCILGQEIEPCFEGAAFLTFNNKDNWSNFQKECKEMFNDIKASCKIEEQEVLGKVSNFELSKDNKDNIEGTKLHETMIVFTTGLNISNKGGKFKMGEIKFKFATANDIRETIYKAINAFNAENEIYDFNYVVTDVKGDVATVFSYTDNTYYTIKFNSTSDSIKTEAPVAIAATFQSKEDEVKAKEAVNNYNILKADNTRLSREVETLKTEKKDYQLTKTEYENLKANADKYAEISEEYGILKEYQLNTERAAKQEIINKFVKLGEAELKVYKENVDKYTAEQLDEKLSAVAFKKGIHLEEKDDKADPVYSFNFDNPAKSTAGMPGWFSLVLDKENKLNSLSDE